MAEIAFTAGRCTITVEFDDAAALAIAFGVEGGDPEKIFPYGVHALVGGTLHRVLTALSLACQVGQKHLPTWRRSSALLPVMSKRTSRSSLVSSSSPVRPHVCFECGSTGVSFDSLPVPEVPHTSKDCFLL